MVKKQYGNSNNQDKKQNKKFEKKAPTPSPELVKYADDITSILLDQMKAFVKSQDNLESLSAQDRIDAERDLFSMDYPTVYTMDNGTELDVYMIDRSVRVDRESHVMKRASCTIIALADNIPMFCTTAYLTSQKTGTINVVQLGEHGPLYRTAIHNGINADMF